MWKKFLNWLFSNKKINHREHDTERMKTIRLILLQFVTQKHNLLIYLSKSQILFGAFS
jgi:hypothetical protein